MAKQRDFRAERPNGRIKSADPALAEAAAALGRKTSPAKAQQAIINATGNKSKSGQATPAETKEKIRASLKAYNQRVRDEKAAKEGEGNKDADIDAG